MYVYNPDTEDFIVRYDGTEYVLKALEATEFEDDAVAEHAKKHLAQYLFNKRGAKFPALELPRIMAELEVDNG